MGSMVEERDEFTVLITGFGPFREQYPQNPSWEIAKGLPGYLPPLRAKDAQARAAAAAAAGLNEAPLPEVRILVNPPEAIRVNYSVVRALVPTLWDGGAREPDAVIHLGMAGPRPWYQVERKGHRTGYVSRDVDGELPRGEDKAERGENGEDWIWHGCPEELETELDIEDVFVRWQKYSPSDVDLRISDDAGHYLCDFTLYSSLAHLWKQQRRRRVTFLHVPADASGRAVSLGRELVVNLVRAVAESELARRRAEEAARVRAKLDQATS